jgi:hypothetical protein
MPRGAELSVIIPAYRSDATLVVCDRVGFPHRRFSRWPLLASAPALRLAALGLRLAGQPALLRAAVRVSPLLVLGLGVWTAGVAAARRA